MGRRLKAAEVAGLIPPAGRKPVHVEDKRQWYFTRTAHIDGVGHPVRLVILRERRNSAGPCKVLVTNRTGWEVTRILSVCRHPWTGTECFHRDGNHVTAPPSRSRTAPGVPGGGPSPRSSPSPCTRCQAA